MKVLTILYTVSLLGLCNCGEPSNLRKEVVDVSLDLSAPDPSFVRNYESTVDGVVYQSFFSNGLFFSKVVDGGVTLWEAEGSEGCSVLFTSVGDRTRAVLHVWVKDLPSKMLHYEKLDGEWKLVTVRVKGVPESEPVSPKEPLKDLDFTSLGCPLGESSGAEAPSHDEDLGELDEYVPETKVEEHETHVGNFSESQPEEVTSQEPEVPVKPTIEPEASAPTHTEEAPVEVTSDGVLQEEGVDSHEEFHQEVDTPSDNTDTQSAEQDDTTLDISNPDETELDVDKQDLGGVSFKSYSPKAAFHISSVVDSGVPVWKSSGDEKCLFVESCAKEDVTILRLETSDGDGTNSKYFEKTGGKWKGIDEDRFSEKVKEIRGEQDEEDDEEPNEKPTEESPETPKSAGQGDDTIPNGQPEPKAVAPQAGTPQQPAPDTSKNVGKDTIDLEDVTDTRYSVLYVDIAGVPARVYVVNPGESIKKIKNGDKDVWKAMPTVPKGDARSESDEKCFYCMVFLNNSGPKATLVKVDDISRSYKELFTYEEKTGCCCKPGWKKSTNNYSETIATFKVGSNAHTKFTLDISSFKEDNERFKLVKEEKNGVTTLFFATKQGYSIENVMDGETKICALNEGFASFLCEVHSKGDHKLVRVHAEKGYAIIFGWYEKSSGTWTAIKEKEFSKKLDKMNNIVRQTQ